MPVAATADPQKVPYRHREYPRFVFTETYRKGIRVENPDEEQALKETIYENPSELPPPAAAVAIDKDAEIARLNAVIVDLRQINGDLVAKLAAMPTPEAEKPKGRKKIEPAESAE